MRRIGAEGPWTEDARPSDPPSDPGPPALPRGRRVCHARQRVSLPETPRSAARPASSRATGNRNGEHDT